MPFKDAVEILEFEIWAGCANVIDSPVSDTLRGSSTMKSLWWRWCYLERRFFQVSLEFEAMKAAVISHDKLTDSCTSSTIRDSSRFVRDFQLFFKSNWILVGLNVINEDSFAVWLIVAFNAFWSETNVDWSSDHLWTGLNRCWWWLWRETSALIISLDS